MIVVREYARLTTVEGYDEALDIRTIPKSAFKWLLDQQVVHFNKGLPLIHIDGAHAIKLDSFVGVIRTPCGTQIEILPKTTIKTPDEKEINKLRNLLVDMIKVSFKLKPRQYERADLVLFKYPLPEWLIANPCAKRFKI
jgi:5-methylcytosine-specific restriction enzyme subunit McrC